MWECMCVCAYMESTRVCLCVRWLPITPYKALGVFVCGYKGKEGLKQAASGQQSEG